MSRLHRFEDYRFVGTRDTMRVYDCDDDSQFEAIQLRMVDDGLLNRNLLQAFSPDTVDEARNRGFKPAKTSG